MAATGREKPQLHFLLRMRRTKEESARTFKIIRQTLNYAGCAKRLCRRKMNAAAMKNTNQNSTTPRPPLNENEEVAAVEIEEEKVNEDACRLYDPGEADNHLPMQSCYYGPSMKGKVINPFKDYKNQTQDIFKSACIKCALCLAVAQSMNETLQSTNLNIECPVLGKNCLCKILEPVCDSGFKNYDLREVNEEDILLTVASPESKHVPTSFDGSWTEKLRETCRRYFDNMDCDLHETLKYRSMSLVDYLCNGDGLFRDCRNMKLKLVDIPDREETNLCAKCS